MRYFSPDQIVFVLLVAAAIAAATVYRQCASF
jgi:hypothetical protein